MALSARTSAAKNNFLISKDILILKHEIVKDYDSFIALTKKNRVFWPVECRNILQY